MSVCKEGQKVTYIGEGEVEVGATGKVVSADAGCAHVLWATGAKANNITLVHSDDLVVASQPPKESLGGPIVRIAVQDVWESQGAEGLLNVLAEEGHFSTFASIADDAANVVAAQVREDPSMREVLAQLDVDDGEELVATVTTALLREAFGD